MFGFGFTEMAVIVLVAVMLFPPRELPKIARGVAKLYGQIRKTADDFRASVLEDEDLNEPIREIRSVYNEARYEVKRGRELTQREIAKARMEARMAAKKVKDSVDPRRMGKMDGAKRKPEVADGAANGVGELAAAEAASDPSTAPAEGSKASAPGERPAREVVVSATAGKNRPEDAPPERRKPRSKLSVPADLEARVGAPVPGRVAQSSAGDASPEAAESAGDDDGSEAGEADKGVA